MRRPWKALIIGGLVPLVLPLAPMDASSGWQAAVPFSNQVASSPFG
jgi:hypothetical protein